MTQYAVREIEGKNPEFLLQSFFKNYNRGVISRLTCRWKDGSGTGQRNRFNSESFRIYHPGSNS